MIPYSEKEMVRIRIAAMKLYGNIPNIRIEIVGADYWDLIVTFINENLKFAVKVGGSTYVNSNQYDDYIRFLHENYMSSSKIPIITACVNESTEDVYIGFVLRWKFKQVVLYSKPGLAMLNPRNGIILKDNIMSMDRTIRVLDNGNLCIKKHLIIHNAFPANQNCIINLIYLRNFSDNYRMKEVIVESELERFHRYLTDTPQNEYPEDEFDCYVKRGLQEYWPNASVQIVNSQFIFNVDLRQLHNEISNYPSKGKLSFQIEPDLYELATLGVTTFQSFKWQFTLLYSEFFDDNLLNEDTIVCQLSSNNWESFSSKIIYYRQSVIDALSITLM